jgi:hypothetical protein
MVIMKNLFRTVSVIALAGWFLACSEKKSEPCYEIIPAPLEIRENFSGGEFVLDDGVCIVEYMQKHVATVDEDNHLQVRAAVTLNVLLYINFTLFSSGFCIPVVCSRAAA